LTILFNDKSIDIKLALSVSRRGVGLEPLNKHGMIGVWVRTHTKSTTKKGQLAHQPHKTTCHGLPPSPGHAPRICPLQQCVETIPVVSYTLRWAGEGLKVESTRCLGAPFSSAGVYTETLGVCTPTCQRDSVTCVAEVPRPPLLAPSFEPVSIESQWFVAW
jgi:hypothetical protein